MSKSRTSKAYAAGAAVGMDKYRKQYGYHFRELTKMVKPNRMMRRVQGK